MRNAKVLVLDVTEDLGHQVKLVTSALRPRPEVVLCDDLDKVDDLITKQGPFDLLVGGTLVSDEGGLGQLRRLRDSSPQMKLVLALDHWRSSHLRDIVRTGALDVLRLPVDDDVLLEAVEWALNNAPVASVEAAVLPPPPSGKGTVTTVVSATGGCGKTFLVANLGYHYARVPKSRTCLLDLDLQFGELSTALRLKPKYTIADLLPHAEDDELGTRLEEYLVHHDTGVSVLAAPDEPAHADAIEADEVVRVIEAAQARFDHVVIDTSAALSEAMLVALDHSDQIFVLSTLDLPSVRNLGLLLSTFEQLKVPMERVNLVLNKVEPDVGIDVDRMTKYFPQGFSMVIPYGRDVNRSLNMGQPVLAYAPRSDVSKALASGLAASVAGVEVEPDAPKSRWRGWRQKRPA